MYTCIITCYMYISLLVHIYGSQEVFVNEYRTLLADRLLMTLDYDTTREVSFY